jgi:hypothetical protein
MNESLITVHYIENSALIIGPVRFCVTEYDTFEILQYHEFVKDKADVPKRVEKLRSDPEILLPPMPEGWKLYEF